MTLTVFEGIEEAKPQDGDAWDYSKDGRKYKSCAVVASDGNGRDVLLEACGPAIDWHIDQVGDSAEELGLAAPEAGLWVWEGNMGSVPIETPMGTDWDHEVRGVWRPLTDEEWDSVQIGECPWTKETLPPW